MEGGYDPLLAQVDKPDLLNDMIPYRCPKCGSLRRFTALRDLKLHLEKEHAFKMECVKPRSRTKVFNYGDMKRGIKVGIYQRTKDGGKFTPKFDDSTKSKYCSRLSQKIKSPDLQRHQDSELSTRFDPSKHPTSHLLKSYNDEARILEMKVKIAKERELSNKLNRNILSDCKGNKSVTSAKQRIDTDDSKAENKFLYSELFMHNTRNDFSVRGDNSENQSLPQESLTLNTRESLRETLHTMNNELLNSRHNQWKKDNALYQAHDVLLGVEEAAENRCLDQQQVIQDLVNDLRQKEGQLTKANEDLERLRRERQALVRETEDLFIQADNGSKVLKKELDRREDMLDNVNEQLHTLRLEATSALERKEEALTIAREKVHGLDNERQRLVRETQDLLRQADKERAVLRRSLDHKENQLRRVNKDMEKLRTEQDDLVQESIQLYEKANDGTSKLKHLVETKDNQLQQAYRELEEMRDVHEKLIQQSHNLTKQANINSQKLTDMLKIKEAELEKAKQELAKVKDERSKIQLTAKDLAQKASHKDLEVERLQRLVNNKGEQLAGKQKELESLKSFLNTAAEKEFVARDQLEQFIKDLISRADIAESELSRLQSQTSSHTDVSRSLLNDSGSKSQSLRSRSQTRCSNTEVESLDRRGQRSKSQPTRTVQEEQQPSATGTKSPVLKSKASNHHKEDSYLTRNLLEKKKSKHKSGKTKTEKWQQILHENYLSDSIALSDSEYQHGEGSQKIDTRLRKPVQTSNDSGSSDDSGDMDPQPKVINRNTEVVEVQVHSVPKTKKGIQHKNKLRYIPKDSRDKCDDSCHTTKSSIMNPAVPQGHCIPNNIPQNGVPVDHNTSVYCSKNQQLQQDHCIPFQGDGVQSLDHDLLSRGHCAETQGHGLTPFQGNRLPFQGHAFPSHSKEVPVISPQNRNEVVQQGYSRKNLPTNDPKYAVIPSNIAKNSLFPKPSVTQMTGQFSNKSFRPRYRPTNRRTGMSCQHRKLVTAMSTHPTTHATVPQADMPVQHRGLVETMPTHPKTHTAVSQAQRPPQHRVHVTTIPTHPTTHAVVSQTQMPPQHRGFVETIPSHPKTHTAVSQCQIPPQHRGHITTIPTRPTTHAVVSQAQMPPQRQIEHPTVVLQNMSEGPYNTMPVHDNICADQVPMTEQSLQFYNKDWTGEHQPEHSAWSYQGQYPGRIESFPTVLAEDLSMSQRYSIRPRNEGQGQTNTEQSNSGLPYGQGQQNEDDEIIYVPFNVKTGQPCPNGQTHIPHKKARAMVKGPQTASPPGQYGRQRRTDPMVTDSRQMRPLHAERTGKTPVPPPGRLHSDGRRSNERHFSDMSTDFHDNSLADVVSIHEYDDFSDEPDDIENEDFEDFMDDDGIMWEQTVQLKPNSRRISPAGSEMSQRTDDYLINSHKLVKKHFRSRSLSPKVENNGTRHVTFDGNINMSSASDGYIEYNQRHGHKTLVKGYHSDLDLSRPRDMVGAGIMKTTLKEFSTSVNNQRANGKKINSSDTPHYVTEKVNKSCQSLKNSGTQTWLLDQPLGTADLEEIRQRSSYVRSVSPSSSHTSLKVTYTDISYSTPTGKTAVSNLENENSHVRTVDIVTDSDLGLPTDFLYKRRPVRGLTCTSSVSAAGDSLSSLSLECRQGEDSNVQDGMNSVKSSGGNKQNSMNGSPINYHRNDASSLSNTDTHDVRHYVNIQKEQPLSTLESSSDHKFRNSNQFSRADNFQSSQPVTKSGYTYSQDFSSSSASRDHSVSVPDFRDQNDSNSKPGKPNLRNQRNSSAESPSHICGPATAMSDGTGSSSEIRNHGQSPFNTVNPDIDHCTVYSRKPSLSEDHTVSYSDHASLSHPSVSPSVSKTFSPSCDISDMVSQTSLINQDNDHLISEQSWKSSSELSHSANTSSEQELQSAAIVSEAISNAFKFLNNESSQKSDPSVENRTLSLRADHKQFTNNEEGFSSTCTQHCKNDNPAVVSQKHKQLLDTNQLASMDTDDMGHSDGSVDIHYSGFQDSGNSVIMSHRRKKKKRKSKKRNLSESLSQGVQSDTGTMETDENAEQSRLHSFRRTSSVASSEESLLDRLPQSRRQEIRVRRNALFQIFRYLDTKSLARVAQVSREWRKVSRQSALWTTVCLCDAAISSQDLVQLSSWCTQLKHLSMIDLRAKVQAENEEAKSTRALLEPGFERLLQVSESTLKSLSIINCDNLLTDKSIWLSSCYSRMMQRVTYLSHTDPLGPDVMWALGAGCGCITVLNIPPLYPCSGPDKFNNKCLQIISQCLPDLEVLEIGGRQIDINGLVLIARACQRLHSLALHHVCEVTDDIAVALSRMGLKSLRCITFVHTPVTAQAVLQFYNGCKHLRDIRVIFSIDDVYENPRRQGNLKIYTAMVTKLKELKLKVGLGNILTLELSMPDEDFQEEEEKTSETYDDTNKVLNTEEEIGTIDRIKNFFK